jgi:hypothetical protein
MEKGSMSSRVVFLAIGFVSLTSGPLLAQPGGPRRGEQDAVRNGWVFSLEEGKAQARKSGKPLMVVVRCVP